VRENHSPKERPAIKARRSITNLIAGAVLLASTSFLAGAAVGPVVGLPISLGAQPITMIPMFRVFWESWNLVQNHYVDRSAVNPQRMTYGAIEGMLNTLGDAGHTRFLTPADLRSELQSISGQLEGIGAQMVVRELGPTILAPLPDSPAQRAGLMPGDTIVRVDGKDVSGLTLEEVVSMIRGPAGTTVQLTVVHPGDTSLTDITVSRERLTVPSVTWVMVPGTTFAHVLVSQFSDKAGEQLAVALRAARDAGATGIIFDVRNNAGGLRDEAIAVASQFIPEGQIVLVEHDAQGRETKVAAKPSGAAVDMPLVVLVNEGSASSAEIVAGAIQDHGRGPLIGATTVGTGTVLSNFQLSDGSALFLGTKQWLTPNGNEIWHKGITPDIPVAMPPATPPLTPQQERNVESFDEILDTQLRRAVATLRSE
jgi:carboxyl-terminal processing protease